MIDECTHTRKLFKTRKRTTQKKKREKKVFKGQIGTGNIFPSSMYFYQSEWGNFTVHGALARVLTRVLPPLLGKMKGYFVPTTQRLKASFRRIICFPIIYLCPRASFQNMYRNIKISISQKGTCNG